MTIIQPKFVALDSSHLGEIARDKASSEESRQRRAATFTEHFDGSGSILLLCWHHIEELLKHRDEATVAERVAFIQSLPIVATIASRAGDELPGSILDLHAHEVAAAFRMPDDDAVTIRDQIAPTLFRCGSGKRAVKAFLEEWGHVQPNFWTREGRAQEIVAISRSDFVNIANTKVADWLKGRLRTPQDTARQLEALRERLAKDIRERGDQRIPDAQSTATQFIDDVIRTANETILDGSNPALQILQAMDIEASDIGPDTTMGEICDLATFRHKLRVINRTLQLPWAELKAGVRESQLPSSIIQSALRRYGQDMPERKGSELTDGYLACLSAYADITYVDKRVSENFRRARPKSPQLAALMRQVEKAGNYLDIVEHVKAA
jgi:hypothetical protein